MGTALTDPLLSGPFTRVLVPLRWGDLDAYGHVNNVTQLQLLEEARARAFGSPTADRDAVNTVPTRDLLGREIPRIFTDASAHTNLLISSHRIEYRRPIPYREGPIAVDVVVSEVGGASMTIGYVVLEPDGARVYSVAETVVVFVDTRTERARRLTEHEDASLRGLVTDPVPLKRH